MTTGRLGYNSVNDRYGLLVSDLWEHGGIHCGAGLEVMVDIRYNRLPVQISKAYKIQGWDNEFG